MKNTLKHQVIELVSRIEFPVIAYVYETGRIIARNYAASFIIGKETNMNKLWKSGTKQKISADILNNGSVVLYKKCMMNGKETMQIDIELNCINLMGEHLIFALFEQSMRRPFEKPFRKRVPRLIWRNKKRDIVGCNKIIELDYERSYIEERFDTYKEDDFEAKNIEQQLKDIVKNQESQFDLLQDVMVEGNCRNFAKLNRIALTNKNGTSIGILTLYTLMLDDVQMNAMADRIFCENVILKEVLAKNECIAVVWKAGCEGKAEFISTNIELFGYQSSEFMEGNITFQDIIPKEDYPAFHEKMMTQSGRCKETETIEYRVRRKDGSIVWVKDETAQYYIKSQENQYLLGKITPLMVEQEKTRELPAAQSIKKALRNKRSKVKIEMHYQPIIGMDGTTCIATEGLLRWNNQTEGLKSPLEIFTLSEYRGIIGEVSEFVLEEAYQMLRDWKKTHEGPMGMHINLSMIELMQSDLIDRMKNMTRKYKIDPENIVFEIKEAIAFDDIAILKAILEEMKQAGFKILLDDFGAGTTSLHTILELPIDYIKIDKSFIQDYGTDKFKPGLLVAITELAHSMDIKVIVSGIETKQQMDFLFLSDIDAYQGYYLSYPMPKKDFF